MTTTDRFALESLKRLTSTGKAMITQIMVRHAQMAMFAASAIQRGPGQHDENGIRAEAVIRSMERMNQEIRELLDVAQPEDIRAAVAEMKSGRTIGEGK